MTQSMTAFARTSADLEGMSVCWEIRSVNHRYLDVSFRLPENWRFLETELRASLRGQIQRGKLECQLKVSDTVAGKPVIDINMELVDVLLAEANSLAKTRLLQSDMSVSDLLKWPGVVRISTPDCEQFAETVLKLFYDTLTQLQQARAAEGAALKEHVQQRLHSLQEETGKAKCLVADQALLSREKLHKRLSQLELAVEPSRLEQEVALILTRLDVSEELDRLHTHIREVDKALNQGESVGRRLDFLMQELNREANTLSSKSDCAALTNCAVEMKVLIEQMREQIQNIE